MPMPRPAALTAALLAFALSGLAGDAAARRSAKRADRPLKAHAALHRTSTLAPRAQDEASAIGGYGRRDDVVAFADEITRRHAIDREWLGATLAQSHYLPNVARLIMPTPAGSAKNWQAYRARFVEPVRIRAGLAFRQANADWLARAEARYGVPAEIILGILGVETIYGRQMGGFRALDALATLAFDFPSGRSDRSAFFRDELEKFLLLCSRNALDPLAVTGSYAGAIGMPQFMPSSILRHAVDFDGDGRIDLRGDSADAIGSVANYLATFGWQRGMPTHYAAAAPTELADRAVLLAPDIVPSFSAQQLVDRGARLEAAALRHPGKLALVELQNGDAAPTYIAGTANFYAITRYNWSSYYAMAVIELGAALAASR